MSDSLSDSSSEFFVYLLLYEFKDDRSSEEEKGREDKYEDTSRAKRKRANRSAQGAKKKAKKPMTEEEDLRHLRLKIPFSLLETLSNKPLTWMSYVGKAILGVEGTVPDPYPFRDVFEDGDVFKFVVDDDISDEYTRLTRAVDMAAILRRTRSVTISSAREDFQASLLPRDGGCVFTGSSGVFVQGTHLIPFARQNAWLELIDDNRKTRVREINDIRNGVTTSLYIHACIDDRQVAILHTPNNALRTKDIPSSETPRKLRNGQKFPKNRRYTLQWLVPPDEDSLEKIPHNQDAAFVQTNTKNLPTPALLDYVYGASVLQQMGEQTAGLDLYTSIQEDRRPRAAGSSGRGKTGDAGRRGTRGARASRAAQAGRSWNEGLQDPSGRHGGGGEGETATVRGNDGWEKLSPESAEAWMMLFRANTCGARDLLDEYAHAQPGSILDWSRNVSFIMI